MSRQHVEAGRKGGAATAKHRMCRTPEYHAWESMKTRCASGPESVHYQNYKARGITVCDEWQRSFTAFYNHVGPRPSTAHSLDRIENNRGYEPGNVRWATRKEQQRNTRRTRSVTIDNVTRPLREWEEMAELPPWTIHQRLSRGWAPERLLEPLNK